MNLAVALLLAAAATRPFPEERLLLDRRLAALRRALPDGLTAPVDVSHVRGLATSAGLIHAEVAARAPVETDGLGVVVLDVSATARFGEPYRFFRQVKLSRAAIHAIDPTIPFIEVRASRGKVIRAEPVALLYARGRVHHVGQFGLLESQMLTWTDEPGVASPDRMDALVWGISALLPSINQRPAQSKSASRQRIETVAAAAARRDSGGLRYRLTGGASLRA